MTQSSSFGVGLSVGIKVELPIISLSTSVSVSTTVTNSKSSSVRKTSSSAVQSVVRIRPIIGNECYVRLNQNSCSFTSDGSVPVSASGYIWFELSKKTKGRTRVGYNLENVLTLQQRSVPIPLSVSIDTKSHGDFESNCVCVDEKCETLKSVVDIDDKGKIIANTNTTTTSTHHQKIDRIMENESRSIKAYVEDGTSAWLADSNMNSPDTIAPTNDAVSR